MSENKESSIPFVGLHAHSVAGSIFDAIGYPPQHMDYAYENGSRALALTDHGNMNGLAHQVLHAKKMQSEGKDFKPVFGIEAYFTPSIKDWKAEYERVKAEQKLKKAAASGATVEDEEASKKAVKNVLNRRRHLILLAQIKLVLIIYLRWFLRAIKETTTIAILAWTLSFYQSIPKESLLLPHVSEACMQGTTGKTGNKEKKQSLRRCATPRDE